MFSYPSHTVLLHKNGGKKFFLVIINFFQILFFNIVLFFAYNNIVHKDTKFNKLNYLNCDQSDCDHYLLFL